MRRLHYSLAILCLFGLLQGSAMADESYPAALNFEMEKLGGEKTHLAKACKGKVVLLVNVASECGLTPQYEQLQELHEKYAKDGLVVIGIPCNQFGKQEPGDAEAIREFCTKNYGVTFELLAKVEVNGDAACLLYKYLTGEKTNPKFAGEIKWNFTKFLISRTGEVVARFEPRVKPDDKKVIAAIERELKRARPEEKS